MATLELTFYKGVPFDSANENVLHCSKADRDSFLSSYVSNIEPIEIEKFFFNGTDDRCFLNVSLSEEPFNVNYLKVIQTLTDSQSNDETQRTLFFFVNSFRQGAENSIELNLSLDKWQSWFEYEENNSITNPQLKNAICVQGHAVSNLGEEEEIIHPANSGENITATALENNGVFTHLYRLVLHTQLTYRGETCFISKSSISYSTAVKQITTLAGCTKAKLEYETSGGTVTTEDRTFDVSEIFLVPDILFGTGLSSEGMANCTFYSENEIVSTIPFYVANLSYNNLQGNIFENTKSFEITPEKATITYVGTGKTNIELPYNNKSYKVYFNLVCANDFSIQMIGNKQRLSITQDYSMSMLYNQFTNYVATNKNSEELRNISTIIGAVGSVIGLGGSVASGNVIGALGSGLGLGKSVLGYYEHQAKLSDMATIPPKLMSNVDSIVILLYYDGLGKFTIEPFNENDILSYDEYFGFKANGFHDSLSIAANTNDRFRYIQCSEIQVIGNFNYDVKRHFEDLFKRGVRIWYNKAHFLDSMTQKIPT